MASPTFRVLVLVTASCLSACSPPQVTPHFYAPSPEASPVEAPTTLEGAIQSVEKLQRQYALEANAVDDNSNDLTTFLIGLTTFGVLKGVTQPSANTTAAVGGIGSATYAYATGNKLSMRAKAFKDGGDRLSCSLLAASPYRMHFPKPRIDSPQNLAEALTEAQEALGEVKANRALLAHYRTPVLDKPARTIASKCGAWTGKEWQAEHARTCGGRKIDAVILSAPVQLLNALDTADALVSDLEKNLPTLRRQDSNTRIVAERLWHNAKIINGNVAAEVRGTIAEPLNALDLAKAFSARNVPKDVTANDKDKEGLPLQGDTSTREKNMTRWELTEDHPARKTLVDLEEANGEARKAANQLQGIVDANSGIPSLSFAELDGCRSSADKVVQSLVATVPGANASDASTNKTLSSGRPVVDAPTEVLKGLGLTSTASKEERISRLNQCQSFLSVERGDRLTPTMELAIKGGQCGNVKWN